MPDIYDPFMYTQIVLKRPEPRIISLDYIHSSLVSFQLVGPITTLTIVGRLFALHYGLSPAQYSIGCEFANLRPIVSNAAK